MMRKLWQVWKRFGRVAGDVIARVILTLFYFTLFVPFALAIRIFRKPLGRRRTAPSFWNKRDIHSETLSSARRGF